MAILLVKDFKIWIVQHERMKELNSFVGIKFVTSGAKVFDDHTDLFAPEISQAIVNRCHCACTLIEVFGVRPCTMLKNRHT